jgi:transcriptional regulator with XRE-family HTH domain
MRLGKLIAKWRFLHEINLRDMAAEIGIGTSTLQRLEVGKMPDAATLIILMNWLFATEAATNAKDAVSTNAGDQRGDAPLHKQE